MKRRLFEYALLLGIVMSVVLLSQTPDVIGHNEIDPDTEKPHKPPGHAHDPSVKVDSEGNPVSTGGEDPRGNHYSGICGETKDGYQTAWGFRYGGGTYADSPSGPDCDTQNVWYIRVDTVASTGSKSASVEVTPSIYLIHYDKKEGSWQGDAEGKVSFSEVNFHKSTFFAGCLGYSRGTDSWSETGFLDLTVKSEEITEEDVKEYGLGFESNGAKLTANSKHSYTTKYNDLRARGYRFLLKLNAGYYDNIAGYQDKDATGKGQLMNGQVKSGAATAEYRWTRWKPCYCGESKEPKAWFE